MRKKKPLSGKYSDWRLAHIREGLRQAEAGRFAPKEEVARVLRRLRRKGE